MVFTKLTLKCGLNFMSSEMDGNERAKYIRTVRILIGNQAVGYHRAHVRELNDCSFIDRTQSCHLLSQQLSSCLKG